MAIKRGVSFYCYQQEQFFKKMNWKDMIREVHDNLHTDGVEIISEAIIPRYPFPSDEFIYSWNNEIARYNMKCVTMDIFSDVMQFRDHVMTHREYAERIKYDIRIAAKMGFEMLRVLSWTPKDIYDMVIDEAVKYNVKLGIEIHAPLTIRYAPGGVRESMHGGVHGIDDGVIVHDVCEYVDKTGTKHLGLIPDFGIFQNRESKPAVDYMLRHADANPCSRFIADNLGKMEPAALIAEFDRRFPDATRMERFALRSVEYGPPCAMPAEIEQVLPYTFSFHGKFYQMTEIPGEPGHYEDIAIPYAEVIPYLVKAGWDGYIDSEYEGQRNQQDLGKDFLPSGVEEVRRHHEMIARLSGEQVDW